MYFTIHAPVPSSPPGLALPEEALGALGRLRQQASLLGGLSASFRTEAHSAVAAYALALTEESDASWRSFVSAAASLVRHAESVDEIVHLNLRERGALEFFAQIVRENEDLLDATAFAHRAA